MAFLINQYLAVFTDLNQEFFAGTRRWQRDAITAAMDPIERVQYPGPHVQSRAFQVQQIDY